MSPIASGCDGAHLTHADAVRRGEAGEPFACGAPSADGADVGLDDLGATMALPSQDRARIDPLGMLVAAQDPMATLTVAVASIGHGRPEEQMIGADAGWIVTVVADEHPWRDGTEMEFPGDAVGLLDLAARATWAGLQDPVIPSARLATSGPFPASLSDADLGPEADFTRRPRLRQRGATDRTETAPSLPPLFALIDRPASLAGECEYRHVGYYSWAGGV